MNNKIKSYITGILIPVGVGLLAAFLTRDNMDIYDVIVTPPLSPPGILFFVVWTVLYVLMGIGSTLVYNTEGNKSDKDKAILLYTLQLIANFFWSILFFNKMAFLFSFIWLVILWAAILAMIFAFAKINKTAALLQIPYLLWVSFAGYLNFAIFLLNK